MKSWAKVMCGGILFGLLTPSLALTETGRWTSLGPDGGYIVSLIIDPANPQNESTRPIRSPCLFSC